MRILVAVPVFNEERYVVPVMREIRKYARAAALTQGVEMRVLVVDDGSTDGTPAALRDLARRGQIDLLTHPENRGYGQSLIDAFAFAAEGANGRGDGGGYDWVITMDCDEQHEPCRIPLFVRECLKDDVDIISGSRYLKQGAGSGGGCGNGAESTPPPDRRNINRIITDLLNSSLHLNVPSVGNGEPRQDADGPGITDSFCGFKAHRVSALQRMNLTIPGYAFPMQFWAQASALGLSIREIPVKLIYKDATRHFGGLLDDPTARLHHYLEVLTAAIRAPRQPVEAARCESACALV